MPAAPGRDPRRTPGSASYFTDHMVAPPGPPDDGWHDAEIEPYGPIQLDPAAAVLHYAQEIFEGLKAYRHADGSVWAFRPEANGAADDPVRPAAGAAGAAGRGLPGARWRRWSAPTWPGCRRRREQSLYLRPFMFASEAFLGVRPARGGALPGDRLARSAPYFTGGIKPVAIWLSTGVHPGRSRRHRCGQVRRQLRRQPGPAGRGQPARLRSRSASWTPSSSRWVEELGGMNLYFVLPGRAAGHAGADRHDPGRGHPVVDPGAGQGAGPGRRGAQGLDRRVARRASPAARSPRCSPAGPPR